MLHVDFSPMIDHVWKNVQMQLRDRREMKKTMFQFLYIWHGLTFTNWTNHTVLKQKVCITLYTSKSSQSRAEAADVTDISSSVYGANHSNTIQGPPDKSCHFNMKKVNYIGLYRTKVMCSVFY